MQTLNLPAGHRLTVTADVNSVGTFWRLSDSVGGEPSSPTALAASSTGTAGPFSNTTRWALDSSLGALTYATAIFAPDAESVDGINGAEILQRDGSIALTADWDAGPWKVRAKTIQSDVVTGTAPLVVASETVVPNLNADKVDGVEAAAMNQLGVVQEATKQHNFDASTLTGLGADSVPNGAFADGSDIAVNGTFTGDTDWTKGDGWTIPATDAQSDGTQLADADLVNTGIALVAGEVYTVTFTVSAWTAGNVTAVVGAQEGTDRGSASTFTELITATNTDPLTLRADADFIGTVDNVSIKLVGDAGWTQGTGWLISLGVAASDASQAGDSDLEDDANAPEAGKTYEVVFTVTNRTAGNVTAVVGNQEGTDRATNATFTQLITASNTDVLKIRADLSFDGDVDNITMKLANVSWDLDDNQVTSITPDQNLVIDNPSNMKDGGEYILHIIQDSVGTRIPTWGSAFKFEGGSAPTLTTTADTGHDVLKFISDGSSMFLSGKTLDLS